MTREEAQRLREEELAGQGHGKDCFIIPQANLDRFLPDGVTLPREPRKSNNLINILEVDDPKIIVSFHLMGQLHPINSMLTNPMVNSLDVHFNLSRNLLKCPPNPSPRCQQSRNQKVVDSSLLCSSPSVQLKS